MPKHTNIIVLAIFFILVLFSLGFSEESITITTYYPSPYGSYNDLHVANTLGIGTTGPGTKLHIAGGTTVEADGASWSLFVDPSSTGGVAPGMAFGRIGGGGGVATIQTFSNTTLVLNPRGGNVGIETVNPQSSLQVGDGVAGTNSYIQIDYISGASPGADCDSNAERGRMYLSTSNRLYVCDGAAGWKYANLN